MGAKPIQPALLPPDHVSLQRRRLKKVDGVNPERIYLAQWKTRNRRHPAVNRGGTLIEWILCPSDRYVPLPVTRRDAVVAASVIQWLGTAVGLGFIYGCERKIEMAERSDAERKRRPSLIAMQREDAERRRWRPARAMRLER